MPRDSAFSRPLAARLAAAQVEPSAGPHAAWQRLREIEGRRTTIIDLYELVARRRGLAGHQLPQAERTALARSVMPVIWPGFARTDGLAAKPTIDVQVSVADLGDESRYVAQIEQAGVQLRSRDDLHRFFRPFAGRPRDVHVHVCQAGSGWEREHLLFRDYLRSHADAREAYVTIKWQAAQVWSDDRIAYTEAKTGIILDLLDAAETWARASSWAVPRPHQQESSGSESSG